MPHGGNHDDSKALHRPAWVGVPVQASAISGGIKRPPGFFCFFFQKEISVTTRGISGPWPDPKFWAWEKKAFETHMQQKTGDIPSSGQKRIACLFPQMMLDVGQTADGDSTEAHAALRAFLLKPGFFFFCQTRFSNLV